MPHAAPPSRFLPRPVHAAPVHPNRWVQPGRQPLLQQQQQAAERDTGNGLLLQCAYSRPSAAEYCARGSLYDVLKQGACLPAAAVELTWRRRVDIALGAARGLLYLHLCSPAILHCDVRWGACSAGPTCGCEGCSSAWSGTREEAQLNHPACRCACRSSPPTSC